MRKHSTRPRTQRAGSYRAPLSYVNESYHQPSSTSTQNLSMSSGTIIRPGLDMRGGGCGCSSLPASRNNITLFGGNRKTRKTVKGRYGSSAAGSSAAGSSAAGSSARLTGGFSPAIMGPVIDNFKYVAPMVTLAAYRFYTQKTKKRSTKKRSTKKRSTKKRSTRAK